MRFVNDYRNIAVGANASFVGEWVHGEHVIQLVAERCIGADKEILVDYGKDYWKVILTRTLTSLSLSSNHDPDSL